MAVAVDAANSGQVTGGTTITFSLTVSGSNRFLLVGITTGGTGLSISSVTYNSVSMTEQYDSAPAPAFLGISYYTLVAPDTGTHDVVVTLASSGNAVAGAVSFTGVDQVTPIDAHTINGGENTDTPTNTVTSATDDMVVDVVGVVADPSSGTAGSGQTERVDLYNTTEFALLLMSTEPGAASVVMDWTVTPLNGSYTSIGININASGGGGGGSMGFITNTLRPNAFAPGFGR